MKKKPELFKRSGKSSHVLRNFLNNLKENDLHYENKQITQCVFLGVLRLKPVPSIFNKNNVPSVSAPAENNKPKRIKNNNSNKELNKNVSKKNDINKVLSGKVSKKNPQKVKAAVKKVPDKKPTIKIKLHTKKKTNKVKKNGNSSPDDKQETLSVSPESSQAVAIEPVLSGPTITLNPIMSPTKFNPVQSLFDKLKQKIDSSYSEPGPSTVTKQTNKTVDGAGPSEEHVKVCKINAKRQVNSSVNANKKSKKLIQRKHRPAIQLETTSPITISDSDSTGKKDDIIVIDGNNLLHSQNRQEINVEKPATEDVIFVNEDPKPVKHKERTSPRNKAATSTQEKTGNFEKHGVIVINDEQKSTKVKHNSLPKSNENLAEAQAANQPGEIIDITGEPKAKDKTRPTANRKAHSNAVEKDSHRLKNLEVQENSFEVEPLNTNLQGQGAAEEVIIITEESNGIPSINKACSKMQNFSDRTTRDKSKMQELNITIDVPQNVKNKGKASPRLLKMVGSADENISVTVKKELIEANETDTDVIVVNEKPKQRKPKLKSPLIPHIFLNAPMLLRSELAPKKTPPVVVPDKPKVTKRRERSKLLRSDMEYAKNLKNSLMKSNEKNPAENSSAKPHDKSSKLLRSELSNRKNSVTLLSPPQTVSSSGNEEVIFVEDHAKKASEKSSAKHGRKLEKTKQTDMQEIDMITEVENECVEPPHLHVEDETPKEDVIILNEEPSEVRATADKKLTSKRLRRSEFPQQKSPDASTNISKDAQDNVTKQKQKPSRNTAEIPKQEDNDVVVIKEEGKTSEKISPRLLRSDITKQSALSSSPTGGKQSESPIKQEEEVLLPKVSPRLVRSNQAITESLPKEDDADECSNEVELSNSQENPSNRLRRSNIQHNKTSVVDIDEDVVVVKEEPKQIEKVSPRTLRSDVARPIKVESPDENTSQEIIIINDDLSKKEKVSPRLLRSEMSQQKVNAKSPQKSKQIDLDEIIVVSEKRVKKTREKTISGRLLRSELAQQKSKETVKIKTDVEEVVVLIHDEPKPKQKSTCSQITNKKINIQEEVIFLAEETQASNTSTQRLLRSDISQKGSPEKTATTTKSLSDDIQGEAKTEKRRLLRSEQNLQSLPNVESENLVEGNRPRSEITSKKSPRATPKSLPDSNDGAEEQTQKQALRSLRSVAAQLSPENLQMEKSKGPIDASTEMQSVVKSEVAPRKSPRVKEQSGSCNLEQLEQEASPPRMLRSVVASQHSPRNLQKEFGSPVESQKLSTEEPSPSRLLRSVGSKIVPEQCESAVRMRVRNQRLLRSEITNNTSIDLEEGEIKSEPLSPKLLSSENLQEEQSVEKINSRIFSSRKAKLDIPVQKSLPTEQTDLTEVVDDANVEKQSRFLRSEMGTQKSPQNLPIQQSETTKDTASSTSTKSQLLPPAEPVVVHHKKKEKSPSRKTRTLLSDLKLKLKTPMLLRSELAQLKTVDTDLCPEREAKKKQKKPGRRSKSTPAPSSADLPVQEVVANVQSSKSKAPKRKSLIDDMKRKKLPKQKEVVMQPPTNSANVIPERKIIPEEISEVKNVNSEIGVEVADNILPNRSEIEKLEESLTDNLLDTVSKVQDASKSVKPKRKTKENQELAENQVKHTGKANEAPKSVTPDKNIAAVTVKDPIERPSKRKTKAQVVPEIVASKADVAENPQEKSSESYLRCKSIDVPKSDKLQVERNSMEYPLKRKNKAQDAPKSIKPKLSKNLSPIAMDALPTPKEVDTKTSEETTPEQNRKRLSAKRKLKATKPAELPISPETLHVPGEAKSIKTREKPPKQVDTTVFDFDETEPEVVPLRLSSPRKDKSVKVTADTSSEAAAVEDAPKPKKQKLAANKASGDAPKTKAQAKAKLLAMLGDKSPQKVNPDAPDKPKGKSTKTKPASKAKTNEQSLDDVPLPANAKKDKKTPVPDKSSVSPPKTATSPMKQTTITDMFSRVLLKKEKANATEAVFGPAANEAAPEEPLKETTNENTMAPPPKVEKKAAAQAKDEEENGLYDDDDEDSDCESRLEWMPEEYAEYKFKYSAKKMMSYKPIHKCKICLLILPSYYRLSQHKKEHAKMPNPYSCTQCDQAFPNIEDLTAHLRIHKGKHPYTCKKCDLGFWSKKSLDAHTPIHVLRKAKKPNKRFRCDVCAKEFGKLCDMDRHTRVHTGEKPCVCNICNKRFQQSHNLSKHLLTHLHVKPYHCEICNKQFGRNDVLNRHLLTHSVDKPIKCPLCPKGFIRQTQLNNHMTKNHPDAARIEATEDAKVEAN